MKQKQESRDARSSTERKLVLRLLLRTTAALAGVFVVLLIGMGLVIDQAYVNRNEVVMKHEVSSLKGIIESIMEDPSELKRDRVEGYLTGLARNKLMVNIRVFSTDTVIAFSEDTAEVGRKFDLANDPACASCHADTTAMAQETRIFEGINGERYYHFTLPIENREVCQECHDSDAPTRGNLVADFSLHELDQSMATTRSLLVVLLAIVFVVLVTAILFWLKRVVYRPLSNIAVRLSAIADGDFTAQSAIPGDDVLGVLNDHIDKMSANLQWHYDLLEEAVAERTLSLRQSQKQLLTEKAKLKLIFDNSPEAIVGLSGVGVVQFANDRVTHELGIKVNEIVGAQVRDFPDLARIVDGDVARRARDDVGASEIVSALESIQSPDGAERVFEVQARVISSKGEEPLLLVMFSDATIKKKVEANLQRHERLASIGQLAAGVAHEVGNPLSAISSVAQLMRTNPNPETAGHNLDLISYHIERISRIVRGLSDLARRPSEDIIVTRISSIIADAEEIASYDHRAKNVEFIHNFPDDELELKVPRDQLMQSLLNIMMNALDATADKEMALINVTESQTVSETTIRISDNGSGMSEETQRQIFEPFYTTKTEGKGTGLGMFITHRIITQMGGSLSVESKQGIGTTFTITLNNSELS